MRPGRHDYRRRKDYEKKTLSHYGSGTYDDDACSKYRRMFKVVIWRGRFFGGNKHGRFGKAGSGNRIKSLNSPEGVALKDDIVIGMKSKHTTIDPMEASNTQHNYMWRMVHDTPIHFNNETKELEPQLATEWSTDDGGKTYIFKLREGVKFHNGETLKASDVVFTFNRMQGTTSCNGFIC